jgi:ribonuclease HII
MADFSLERLAWDRGLPFYGFDESSYGSAAGSMWVAVVSFDPSVSEADLAGVKDSKKTTKAQRTKLAARIRELGKWKLWEVTAKEIDEGNPYYLRYEVMMPWLALRTPGVTCFDGNRALVAPPHENTYCVKGDNVSLSIGAASILAKEARDLECEQLDKQYPDWGFLDHSGYLSTKHQEMIKNHGVLTIHRQKYVRNILAAKTTESVNKEE